MIVRWADTGRRGRPPGRQPLASDRARSKLLLKWTFSNTFAVCSCFWGLVTGAVAAGLLARRRVLAAVVAVVVLEGSGATHRASPRAVRSGRHVARPPWSPPDPVRSGVWGGRCDRGGGRGCAHPRGPRRRRARPDRRGGCRRCARARRGRRLRRPRRGAGRGTRTGGRHAATLTAPRHGSRAGRPVAPGATGSARPRRVPRWPRRCSARPSARFSTPRRASRRWWTRRAR